MKLIQGLECSLPLFAGTIHYNPKNKSEWGADSTSLMGTVFKIKDNVYMTAGHVVRDGIEKGNLLIGYLNEEKKVKVSIVKKFDVKLKYDIAFLEADVPGAVNFPWSFEDVPALVDIKAIGYPFGLDTEHKVFTTRGQKGYIVSDCTYHLENKHKTNIYELSMPIFDGMSGAALLLSNEKSVKVVGVCLGNRETKMKIFDSSEYIEENGQKETIQVHHAYTLGVAIKSTSLANLESELFHGKFSEFVEKE